MIGDSVIILDDSIVPAETVIPSYSVYGGRPAVFQAELPETANYIFRERSLNFYKNFLPKKDEKK
jgi:dynactin-5